MQLPGSIRTHLAAAAAEIRGNTIAVKWVEPANLHLTLAFLGSIAPDSIETVAGALLGAAAGEPAFMARIETLGAFPNPRRPRVIWAGMSAGAPELQRACGRVRDELRAADVYFDDKPFSPHVTLGRLRDGVVAPSELLRRLETVRIATEPFEVGAIHLMKSRLTPSGPIYDALRVAVLGGESRR